MPKREKVQGERHDENLQSADGSVQESPAEQNESQAQEAQVERSEAPAQESHNALDDSAGQDRDAGDAVGAAEEEVSEQDGDDMLVRFNKQSGYSRLVLNDGTVVEDDSHVSMDVWGSIKDLKGTDGVELFAKDEGGE